MKKIVHILCCLVAIASFIFVLGSVGALEQDAISLGQCIGQAAIGYVIAIAAIVAARN